MHRTVAFAIAASIAVVAATTRADEPPKEEPLEVRVIGDKADALQKIPGSGELVTKREIDQAQARDLTEILKRVPGIQARQDESGGLRMDIGVRGLDATRGRRVLLLEDGVPIAANPYAEPDLYFAPPVERMRGIEVVKGSGSILFGPQTIGGVINFLTVLPPTHRIAELRVDGGQYGYFDFLGRYGDAFERGRWVVQAFRKRGDGFRGERFEINDAFAKLALDTSERGELTLKIGVHDEAAVSTSAGLTQKMFLTDPRQPNFAPYDHVHALRFEASAIHEHAFSVNTKLRTLAYAYTTFRIFSRQDYERTPSAGTEYDHIVGDPGTPGGAIYFKRTDNIQERSFDVVGLEPRLEHRFETGPIGHTVAAGARILYEYGQRPQRAGDTPTTQSGALQIDEDHRTVAFAGYFEDRVALRDELLVTPGIRFEDAEFTRNVTRTLVNGVPQDVDIRGDSNVTGIVPGIGVIAGTPQAHGFAGVHVGFAPPRIDTTIGASNGVDQLLDAERSIEYELGARAKPRKWLSGEATGFLITFSNQVIPAPGGIGMQTEINGGATRHIGLEAGATLGFGSAFALPIAIDLTGRYTLSRATFTNGQYDGNVLPYSPLHTTTTTLDIAHPKGPALEVSWTHVSSQFADQLNTVAVNTTGTLGRIEPYDVFDAGVRYLEPNTKLTLGITAKNLFDTVYVANRKPDGIFLGGFRQVIGSIKWEYEEVKP